MPGTPITSAAANTQLNCARAMPCLRASSHDNKLARAEPTPGQAVPARKPYATVRLVWRFRSPHHSCRESEMGASEPKPHWINKLLVSFDSEARKTSAPQNEASFGIG